MDVAIEEDPVVVLGWTAVALEGEILAILDARPAAGERLEVAFRRKEHELKQVLARLSIADARALHRRLVLSLPGDPIASRVGRLVVERRERLLHFLADARRREALGKPRLVGTSVAR
jgi:hypothetical protein